MAQLRFLLIQHSAVLHIKEISMNSILVLAFLVSFGGALPFESKMADNETTSGAVTAAATNTMGYLRCPDGGPPMVDASGQTLPCRGASDCPSTHQCVAKGGPAGVCCSNGAGSQNNPISPNASPCPPPPQPNADQAKAGCAFVARHDTNGCSDGYDMVCNNATSEQSPSVSSTASTEAAGPLGGSSASPSFGVQEHGSTVLFEHLGESEMSTRGPSTPVGQPEFNVSIPEIGQGNVTVGSENATNATVGSENATNATTIGSENATNAVDNSSISSPTSGNETSLVPNVEATSSTPTENQTTIPESSTSTQSSIPVSAGEINATHGQIEEFGLVNASSPTPASESENATAGSISESATPLASTLASATAGSISENATLGSTVASENASVGSTAGSSSEVTPISNASTESQSLAGGISPTPSSVGPSTSNTSESEIPNGPQEKKPTNSVLPSIDESGQSQNKPPVVENVPTSGPVTPGEGQSANTSAISPGSYLPPGSYSPLPSIGQPSNETAATMQQPIDVQSSTSSTPISGFETGTTVKAISVDGNENGSVPTSEMITSTDNGLHVINASTEIVTPSSNASAEPGASANASLSSGSESTTTPLSVVISTGESIATSNNATVEQNGLPSSTASGISESTTSGLFAPEGHTSSNETGGTTASQNPTGSSATPVLMEGSSTSMPLVPMEASSSPATSLSVEASSTVSSISMETSSSSMPHVSVEAGSSSMPQVPAESSSATPIVPMGPTSSTPFSPEASSSMPLSSEASSATATPLSTLAPLSPQAQTASYVSEASPASQSISPIESQNQINASTPIPIAAGASTTPAIGQSINANSETAPASNGEQPTWDSMFSIGAPIKSIPDATAFRRSSGPAVATSGQFVPCQRNSDCFQLREPDEWCKRDESFTWTDKSCFCAADTEVQSCIIERFDMPSGRLQWTFCTPDVKFDCNNAVRRRKQ